jgi:hypothetical protein
MCSGVRLAGSVVALMLCAGCAFQYSDSKTGTEHLWGFGHLAMKVSAPNEGKKAIVRGVTLCGVGLGLKDGWPFLTLGWERQQSMDIVDANTSVRLEGPDSDLFKARVGSQLPSGGTRKGEP